MLSIDKLVPGILIDPNENESLIIQYSLDGKILDVANKHGKKFPVQNGVVDFVNDSNYADNFGDQWTRFPKLQMDSFNKTTISRDRFLRALSLSPAELCGKLILDVGCGTGRFAEIALEAGAIVVGLDYSSAAYIAAKNLERYKNFLAICGDIYNLPFKKKSFDLVYCLGVLQHTPDVEKAFKNLPSMVKDHGLLVVDYYWKRLRSVLGWKYIIRLITSQLQNSTVLKMLQTVHPIVYPLSDYISKIPKIGKTISRLLPVVNYNNDYPQLGSKLLRAWSFLDTYDSWAPKFDQPQTVTTVKKWANDLKLKNIEVEHVGQLVVRGLVSDRHD
mgnify:CR=1 FL=1